MRLREKALKGDNRALETLLSLAKIAQQREAAERLGGETIADQDQAILDAFAEDLRSRPGRGRRSTSDLAEMRTRGDG